MLVDAHVHIFWPEAVRHRRRLFHLDAYFAELYQSERARMATAEDLIHSMEENGIDVSIVAGFGWADAGLCREHNAYIAEAVRRYPGRLIGLAVVNPSDRRNSERELARWLDAGLAGVGELMPNGPGYRLTDAFVMGVLTEVSRSYHVPILVHVSEPVGHDYPGKGTVTLAEVLELATCNPELKIVCAHWGGGLPFYELMPEVQAALKNVYYDTAAWPLLYDDRIFLAGDVLAPRKVLFATDYPLVSQSAALKRLRSLALPPDLWAAYTGGNAFSVYMTRSSGK